MGGGWVSGDGNVEPGDWCARGGAGGACQRLCVGSPLLHHQAGGAAALGAVAPRPRRARGGRARLPDAQSEDGRARRGQWRPRGLVFKWPHPADTDAPRTASFTLYHQRLGSRRSAHFPPTHKVGEGRPHAGVVRSHKWRRGGRAAPPCPKKGKGQAHTRPPSVEIGALRDDASQHTATLTHSTPTVMIDRARGLPQNVPAGVGRGHDDLPWQWPGARPTGPSSPRRPTHRGALALATHVHSDPPHDVLFLSRTHPSPSMTPLDAQAH